MKSKMEKKYKITVTEDQLRLIAECVEDCHRFMAGRYGLDNMTSRLEQGMELQCRLKELKPLITPELPDPRSIYGWNGGNCHNERQRKFIAQTYAIYREIYHRLTIENKIIDPYFTSTLTCEEGGQLPEIELVHLKRVTKKDGKTVIGAIVEEFKVSLIEACNIYHNDRDKWIKWYNEKFVPGKDH